MLPPCELLRAEPCMKIGKVSSNTFFTSCTDQAVVKICTGPKYPLHLKNMRAQSVFSCA